MASNLRKHNDYTVGLPKPPSDSNAYTLGSIGGHNIAIACLPKGKIGTSSAAVVASQIVSTFPAIRFGLLVGIGGGAFRPQSGSGTLWSACRLDNSQASSSGI
ncbi:hypothetical protein PG995_007815 [Apiospora arundinis]